MARVRRPEDFVDAITRLCQCILRVSDLWFTIRNKIGESIVDDVEDLLQENNIAFNRSPKILGRSAKPWQTRFSYERQGTQFFCACPKYWESSGGARDGVSIDSHVARPELS